MSKVEEMMERFIKQWACIKIDDESMDEPLKLLIQNSASEMRADLQEIIDAVREEDKNYIFYCGNCRQPFGAKRGATMCPLCESHEISLMDFTSMKKEQAGGEGR